jgi:hypothetical protein
VVKKKKQFFIIAIIAVVILFFSVIYFSLSGFEGGITSVHFETFSDGTEIGPNIVGIVTNSFSVNDIVGVSGESNVNKEVELTFQIFDMNGNKIKSLWKGDKIKIQSGTFSFCCLNLPQQQGVYTLKIYLNNKETTTLFFDVIG